MVTVTWAVAMKDDRSSGMSDQSAFSVAMMGFHKHPFSFSFSSIVNSNHVEDCLAPILHEEYEYECSAAVLCCSVLTSSILSGSESLRWSMGLPLLFSVSLSQWQWMWGSSSTTTAPKRLHSAFSVVIMKADHMFCNSMAIFVSYER